MSMENSLEGRNLVRNYMRRGAPRVVSMTKENYLEGRKLMRNRT